jgi:hypothetical protein
MASGYSVHVVEGVRTADGKRLGVQLGRLCVSRDIPVSRVSLSLGVSRQTVYSWFLGKSEPRPALFGAIETLLSTLDAET